MKLNKIFTSNMVFPGHKPVRIYGTGKGKVEISFADCKKELTSFSENWMVEFPAMEYGGPYTMEVKFEDANVTLNNIYIGEVFLFAGQSNMEFKMKETNFPKENYTSNDKIRLFSTDRIEKNKDIFTSDDGWVMCDKKDVDNWSALAYLTSSEIAKQNDIAIGVIVCYQGASVIESWVPNGAFKNIGIDLTDNEKFNDHINEKYSAWNGDGVLYNFAFSQVVPYSLSSVVWYQGESDTSDDEGKVYLNELCELIKIWRTDLLDENLPFVIVQIADCIRRMTPGWILVQKAQKDIEEKISNVKTVISKDVCETDEIHPKTKDKLAKRIGESLMKICNMG